MRSGSRSSRFRSTRRAPTGLARVDFSRPPISSALRCHSLSKQRSAVPYKPGGRAPSPAYIDDFVSSSDGLRLAKAFMQIENAEMRRRIVNLVQEVAGSHGD